MFLGVCSRLETSTGIPAFLFRILFVLWSLGSGWGLIWYFIIYFLLD
jgi:phage shock protein PspC (stress-responsive transcriptional regulator)